MYTSEQDLTITTSELASVASMLDVMADQVDVSMNYLHFASTHVGHEGLTSVVATRASEWEEDQETLTDLLSGLSTSMQEIVRAFTETDIMIADSADGMMCVADGRGPWGGIEEMTFGA
ncbi:hypothetical protein [Demequina sediminicola]|uniref:hypothetical protein n=1 Tax=Demequina sediminicola TaxID=1095026 RepID=UPI000785B02D|nr:hypothetical protein [Demequina sediminicola]